MAGGDLDGDAEDPTEPTIDGLAAVNGYSATLYPGMNGITQDGLLRRLGVVGALTESGLIQVFEWKTAPLTITVVDQFASQIPASAISVKPVTSGVSFAELGKATVEEGEERGPAAELTSKPPERTLECSLLGGKINA